MYGVGRFQTLAEIDDMDFGRVERILQLLEEGLWGDLEEEDGQGQE